MDTRIIVTLEYYFQKRKEILNFINSYNNLTADQISENGEVLGILEYKITALQVAQEN